MKKTKEKDYFYKLKMKRNLYISIVFLIISVIGFTIGFKLVNKNNEFIKKSIKTEAVIVEINYKNELNREDIKSVYVSFVVDGQEYKAKLNQISKSMYKGKQVDIYYNPNNPNEIILESHFAYIFAGIMFVMIWGSILEMFNRLGKVIKYYIILKGKEVEAEIVQVIEKNNWFGRKSFVIECKWKDISDAEYTFYSEPFTAPYFMKEFEKMDIKKLIVRFKEDDKTKYIVLTEKIDKRLYK